jgi:hypothetical protein
MGIHSFLFVFALLPNIVFADAPAGTTTTFTSPNGVQESCVILNDIPGGDYSKDDRKITEKDCGVDLYEGKTIALCPKTWSTSAAVMVYDITKLNVTAADYESTYCKGKEKPDGVKTIYKLKTTMNQSGTSGTFSPSPQMYYHFSRYFGTAVGVPPTVYREMDPKANLDRVGRKGLSHAAGSMNKAAWTVLTAAAANPRAYNPTDDLFTTDSKFYGTALKDVGERYGTEVNGARQGKGYVAQNMEFQQTAPFQALRTPGDLNVAVSTGLRAASTKSALARDLVNVSPLQMIFWMREVTEIALLDYIFSQQDRVGNIDFEWKWYWVQDGKVESAKEKSELPRQKMSKIPVPAEIAAFNPVLVQRSHIGDNDAGGRVQYANFSKKTNMLADLRHFSGKIYAQLMHLDQDLQSKGEIYQYLAANFNLNGAEINQVVSNTHSAAALLKTQCEAKTLRFDLDEPKKFLIDGDKAVDLDCVNPVF